MEQIATGFGDAFGLLLGLDAELWAIVGLSLAVSGAAIVLATLCGLPLGAALALYRFPGRRAAVIVVNALMGLPPVVVGLLVYLLLSRTGPLGRLDMLFTPGAMVLAQTILILPIVAALTRHIVEELWQEYQEQLRSLGCTTGQAMRTLLWDGRFSLLTTVLAGFGRATAEVGAVMIVGGNIAHLTRVMTTTIALETGRGNLALAVGLGLVLMLIALLVNTGMYLINDAMARRRGVRFG